MSHANEVNDYEGRIPNAEGISTRNQKRQSVTQSLPTLPVNGQDGEYRSNQICRKIKIRTFNV